MKHHKLFSPWIACAAPALLLMLCREGLAGPPLICQPLDIGGAKSLPWSDDLRNMSGKADYDLARLATDTLELLTPGTPVVVRMETLRRAALYSQRNQAVAKELLLKLRARALDAEAKGQPDALAWFDLGYLVECIHQGNWTFQKLPSGAMEQKPNVAMNLDGYAWVLKAIQLKGQDPQMEFAAALITEWPRQKSYEEHLRKAVAEAQDGSLLAKNLVLRFGNHASTIAELRAQVGGANK
jgi:hypothetical protein